MSKIALIRTQFADVALALALAAMLAGAPLWAHAGVTGWVVGKVAEKAADVAKDKAIDAGKELLPSAPPPVALPRTNGFAGCAAHFPRGIALDIAKVDRAWRPYGLCASHYAVLYSGLTKTPLVVVERLTRDQLMSALDEQRTEVFFPDDRLPARDRAELRDYVGSGFDRGHNAPAADMPDATAMAQSFVLSNMIPQDPENNRKAWAKIESDTRKYARRAAGNVFVYTGPLFKGESRTIGPGKVWVPSHIFKLVYDEQSGRSWAFVLPNTASARVGAPIDYQAFLAESGWALLGAPAAAVAAK